MALLGDPSPHRCQLSARARGVQRTPDAKAGLLHDMRVNLRGGIGHHALARCGFCRNGIGAAVHGGTGWNLARQAQIRQYTAAMPTRTAT